SAGISPRTPCGRASSPSANPPQLPPLVSRSIASSRLGLSQRRATSALVICGVCWWTTSRRILARSPIGSNYLRSGIFDAAGRSVASPTTRATLADPLSALALRPQAAEFFCQRQVPRSSSSPYPLLACQHQAAALPLAPRLAVFIAPLTAAWWVSG